jgi:hypothetical protein
MKSRGWQRENPVSSCANPCCVQNSELLLCPCVLTSERDGVDVLAIITDRHVRLTKANGVLSSGDAIELLEFSLIDKLQDEKECTKHQQLAQADLRGTRMVCKRAAVLVSTFEGK